jgi:hypothetical protein
VLGFPSDLDKQAFSFLNLVGGSGKFAPGPVGESHLRSAVRRFRSGPHNGPLIDPKLPRQTITIGVRNPDPGLAALLADQDQMDEAARVESPANQLRPERGQIVLQHYRAERAAEGTFGGTFMINGIYFAHSPELGFGPPITGPSNPFAPTQGVELTVSPDLDPDRRGGMLVRFPHHRDDHD